MRTYHVVLIPDDGSYMVLVPSLPGCITYGSTVADALTMAREAIALHIEGMAADGEEIPTDEGEPLMAIVEVEAELSPSTNPTVGDGRAAS